METTLFDTKDWSGTATRNLNPSDGLAWAIRIGTRCFPCRREKLGFKHGQFHKFSEEVPLSNLFVTMMNKLGMHEPSLVDSTGELTEVVG